jgi:hypothetical protein
MTWTMPCSAVAHRVAADAELGAVARSVSTWLARSGRRSAVDVLGRDVVVLGRHGEVGPAHGAAGQPQPVERLRAGDLVHEVQVDVEQVGLASARRRARPDLLGQRTTWRPRPSRTTQSAPPAARSSPRSRCPARSSGSPASPAACTRPPCSPPPSGSPSRCAAPRRSKRGHLVRAVAPVFAPATQQAWPAGDREQPGELTGQRLASGGRRPRRRQRRCRRQQPAADGSPGPAHLAGEAVSVGQPEDHACGSRRSGPGSAIPGTPPRQLRPECPAGGGRSSEGPHQKSASCSSSSSVCLRSSPPA